MTETDKFFKAQKEGSQEIGAFLDWLMSESGLTLCRRDDSWEHPWMPAGLSIEALLAEYYGIDLQELDRERRALLKSLGQPEEVRDA